MGVRPTKTKGTYRRTEPSSGHCLPVLDFGVHIKGGYFKIKMLVRLLEMESRHQFFVLHGEQDFLQARHASRRRGMTDIAFDRTYGTILFARRFLLKNSR